MGQNDNTNVELQIRAKNLTKEAFAKVSEALKALEEQSERVPKKGQTSWSKWFATITGGVAVGNLVADAFKTVGGLLAQIPGQLVELGKRGGDVADVANAFEGLTASVGETSSAMLGELRSAFGGTVTDFELMKSTNDALRRGLQITSGEMGTLVKGARILADQVGGDAKQNFDGFLSAISKGNERELKQLGLNMANVERSVKSHATALGVEVGALSESQKQHALRNAVVAESTRLLKENGEVTNDMADNVKAISVMVDNFTDSLGVAIASSPALSEALQFIHESMQEAFGPDQTTNVQTLIGWVDKGAIILVDFAQAGVTGARAVGIAWAALKTTFLAITTVLGGVFTTLGATVTGVLTLASKIPGASRLLGDLADSAAAWSQKTAQSTMELAAMTAESAKGVVGQDAFGRTLDAVGTKLGQMRERMVAASREQVSNEAITKKLGATHRTTGENIGAAAKLVESYEKSVRELSASLNLAIKNKAFETWVERHADALLKLNLAGAELGRQLPENLKKALLAALTKDDAQLFAKEWQAILERNAAADEKSQGRRNEALQTNLTARVAAETAASEMYRKRTMGDLAFQLDVIQREQQAKKDGLEKTAAGYHEALTAIEQETDERMRAASQAYAQAMAEMEASTNSWGNLTRKWIDSIPALLQSALTGGGGVSGFTKALGSMIGDDVGTKLFTKVGNKMSGGLTKLFGQKLGGEILGMIPGIGGAIGSLPGPAIAKVGDWITGGPEWKKLKRDIGRDMGVDISEALAQALEKDSKKFGRNVASALHLDEIIKEAGGIEEFGLDKAIAKTRDLFVFVEKGQLTTRQAGKQLDAMWSQILPAAIDKTSGRLSAQAKELIQLDKRFGTHSQGISDFLKTAAGGAATKLGGFLTEAAKAAEFDGKKIREEMKKVDDEMSTMMRDHTQEGDVRATAESTARWRELGARWDQLKKELSAGEGLQKVFTLTETGASAMAASISAAFAKLREEGVPITEALAQVEPAVTNLDTLLQKAGFEGGAAFADLKAKIALTKDEIAGPALSSMQALGGAIVDLENAGALTREEFTGLTGQLGAMYAELKAQGKGGEQALALLGPQLQAAWELAEEFGAELDENTQKMLDEAEASGIVGEQHKTDAKKMVEGLQEVNANLRALLEGMGIKLPQAIRDAAGEIRRRSGEIKRDLDGIPRDIDINVRTNRIVEGDDAGRRDHGGTEPEYSARGIFATGPRLTWFGEGGEPELGGPIGFMEKVLAGALERQGGAVGGEVHNYYDNRQTHIDAIDVQSFADAMRRPGGGVDVLIQDVAFDKQGRGTKLRRAQGLA